MAYYCPTLLLPDTGGVKEKDILESIKTTYFCVEQIFLAPRTCVLMFRFTTWHRRRKGEGHSRVYQRPKCAWSDCSRCGELQRGAVCCSALRHDAVWCSVLQCVAACCGVVQCVAVLGLTVRDVVSCSVGQCVAVRCRVTQRGTVCCRCCSVLQCVAVLGQTLRDVVSCSVLQRVVECCSVL